MAASCPSFPLTLPSPPTPASKPVSLLVGCIAMYGDGLLKNKTTGDVL